MPNGTIGVRDGELTGTLEFGPVRVVLGITEMNNLLRCAFMDTSNCAPSVRATLREPLRVLMDACSRAICEAPRSPTEDADMAANLARWQATGTGGVTDMEGVRQWAAGVSGKTAPSMPATAPGRACGS